MDMTGETTSDAARNRKGAHCPSEAGYWRARTERDGMKVTVKEREDGRPFLMFEGAHLPSLPGVHFGLDLAPETTLEHARWLADRLNGWAVSLYAVIFEPETSESPGAPSAAGD